MQQIELSVLKMGSSLPFSIFIPRQRRAVMKSEKHRELRLEREGFFFFFFEVGGERSALIKYDRLYISIYTLVLHAES